MLDKEFIGTFKIEHGVIVWPNGLDLAPDSMYKKIKESSKNVYEIK